MKSIFIVFSILILLGMGGMFMYFNKNLDRLTEEIKIKGEEIEVKGELIKNLTDSIVDLKLKIQNRTFYELDEKKLTIKNMKCNSIQVLDETGVVRYSLKSNAGKDVQQNFYDTRGIVRLNSGITSEDIARIRLFDERGTARVSSSVYRTDSDEKLAGLTIYYPNEKPALNVINSDKIDITSTHFDRNGTPRMITGYNQGEVAQSFYNYLGSYKQGIGINRNDITFIESANNKGEVVFGSHTYSDGTNKTYIYRSPGAKIWDLASNFMTALGYIKLFK